MQVGLVDDEDGFDMECLTGEEHDRAGFGTLHLGHGGEGAEDVVGQGHGYAFFLLLPTVAWVRAVRHLSAGFRGQQLSPNVAYLCQSPISLAWRWYLLLLGMAALCGVR